MAKSTTVTPITVQHVEAQLFVASDPSKRIRLEGVTVNYGVNMVPSAIIRLPIGQQINSDFLSREDPVNPEWFNNKTLLRVGVRIKSSSSTSVKELVLFEGYADKPNFSVHRQGYELSAQMQHWTRDLSIGSLLAEYAFPRHSDSAQMWSFFYPAASSAQQGGQGVFHSPEAIPRQLGLPANWRQSLPTDIWANGQKPILAFLAGRSLQKGYLRSTQCADAMNQPPKVAADALQKIQGPGSALGRAYTTGVKPLQLRGGRKADSRLVDTIATTIGYNPLSSYSGSTFWNVIMDFCGQFGLGFIARPTDAFIQPIAIGLNQHYEDRQVLATEFHDGNFSNVSPTPIRGFVVATQTISHTNIDKVMPDNKPELNPTGCHIASKDPNDGSVLFISPPSWLSAINFHRQGGNKTGRTPRGANEPERKDPVQPASGLPDLLNEYAQLRYTEERLRNRVCQISCEISELPSPGSTIAVTLPQQVHQYMPDLKSIIGVVTQISATTDRTANRMLATVALSGVRTLDEYNKGQYSSNGHPLFDNVFVGAPLET